MNSLNFSIKVTGPKDSTQSHSKHQVSMRALAALVLYFGVVLGQNLDQFLKEHRAKIQDFIMAGYGEGWTNCDVLSLNPTGVDDAPQFIMGFETFNKLDINSALSSSHCLLTAHYIESKESLSAIIKFGWIIIQHKRVALILSMAKGITLDMASNTEKLPFLIVAILEGGGKQFLCPIIGRAEPLLQVSLSTGKGWDMSIRPTHKPGSNI